MRKFLLAASVTALCATPAFAGDEIMANTFGNTVVSTGGMSEVHSHYRADHSFDMAASMMGMSQTFKGTWALDGKGNLCRTFDGAAPPNTPNPLSCRSPRTNSATPGRWTPTARPAPSPSSPASNRRALAPASMRAAATSPHPAASGSRCWESEAGRAAVAPSVFMESSLDDGLAQ
jgi:hypothetical protein